ncbi:MAG: biopolymer transporter ExbD [Rhodothermaceae bacterium]|nr:biopolymer transporter ExbD [Rhodothermaceae bacterium]
MQRRGLIIRFIDIGLLILFGFLMISDLKGTSQISFNEGDAQDFFSTLQDDSILLGVNIENDGRLSINDISESRTLHQNILSIEELEFLIGTMKNQYAEEGKELSILIEPAPDAQIQYVVHVLDVCDRLGLSKNLNTEVVRNRTES